MSLVGEGGEFVDAADEEKARDKMKICVLMKEKSSADEEALAYKIKQISEILQFKTAKGPLLGFTLPNPDSPNPSITVEQVFARLSRLLAKDALTPLEDRIISAFQWAGRATVAVRREEAFTFYMIALETPIKGRKKLPEITLKRKYKFAHLLKSTVEARGQIVESINMLYNTMSEIVHSGRFQVTDTELLEVRQYVKQALLTVIEAEPFRDMTDEKQLDTGWTISFWRGPRVAEGLVND